MPFFLQGPVTGPAQIAVRVRPTGHGQDWTAKNVTHQHSALVLSLRHWQLDWLKLKAESEEATSSTSSQPLQSDVTVKYQLSESGVTGLSQA